jgi:hypothetical protein
VSGDIVVSLPDLLHLTGCTDLDELGELVDGDADVDMWVEEMDGGIEVRTGRTGTGLLYPFPMADFWEVVAEAEDDEVRQWG